MLLQISAGRGPYLLKINTFGAAQQESSERQGSPQKLLRLFIGESDSDVPEVLDGLDPVIRIDSSLPLKRQQVTHVAF
jgi:hypothetical protein